MSTKLIWGCIVFGVLAFVAIVALASCTPYDTAPQQPSGIEIDIDTPKGKRVEKPKAPAPKPAAPKQAAPKGGGKR